MTDGNLFQVFDEAGGHFVVLCCVGYGAVVRLKFGLVCRWGEGPEDVTRRGKGVGVYNSTGGNMTLGLLYDLPLGQKKTPQAILRTVPL